MQMKRLSAEVNCTAQLQTRGCFRVRVMLIFEDPTVTEM